MDNQEFQRIMNMYSTTDEKRYKPITLIDFIDKHSWEITILIIAIMYVNKK